MSLTNTSLLRFANYINGEWVIAESRKSFPVLNPADNTIIGQVPRCGAAETKRAIIAANAAFTVWRQYSAKERSDLLLNWAALIDKNKEDLAILMTLEQGKPLAEARGEIDYANGFIKWYAEEARRVYGDIIPSNKREQHLLVLKQPIGVVAAITPWNFPAAMITRKIAPALAAGCTVIVKPAEETPLSALALAVLAQEAGIPPGVINVITGVPEEIGKVLTSDSVVRMVSFTGSTTVGKLLMQQCATTVKKVALELGGNAPFIIFNDANIDAAVAGLIQSKFRNAGQTCICANRIFVQDAIYKQFIDKFHAEVKKLKVGNGLDKEVTIGPLINIAALEKVKHHVNDALVKGGKIICGGQSHALGGLYFEPTIILDAAVNMQLAQEETFGPVAPIFRFNNDNEVIQLANQTSAGLAAYFYTQDIERVWKVAESLEYGIVGVNTGLISTEVAPFGGIKESGIGREGSKYGIDEYIELKYVCIGRGK